MRFDKVKFRSSSLWKHKRKEILNRDNHKCLICGCGQGLQVHHIISLDVNPKLRLENRNLLTVCDHCHTAIHNGVYNNIYLTNLINE